MGVHDEVIIAVLVVVILIVRFPQHYRRGMARLCSVEEDRIPVYPRSAAIALFVFFGFVLFFDLLRHFGWR